MSGGASGRHWHKSIIECPFSPCRTLPSHFRLRPALSILTDEKYEKHKGCLIFLEYRKTNGMKWVNGRRCKKCEKHRGCLIFLEYRNTNGIKWVNGRRCKPGIKLSLTKITRSYFFHVILQSLKNC